jgi:hypothetical protein
MLPTIPTDNLFKFLGISGLILAGFCVWGSHDLENRLRTNEVIARNQYIEFIGDVEDKLNAVGAKADVNEPAYMHLAVPDPTGNYVFIKPGSQYPLAVEDKYRDAYRQSTTYLDNWLAGFLPHAGQAPVEGKVVFTPDVLKDLRSKLRQHDVAVENLWRQTDNTMTCRRWAFLGTIIGILVSATGFVFWIFGQKRQDTLESLKIQKDKKELDGPVHTTVIEPKVTS